MSSSLTFQPCLSSQPCVSSMSCLDKSLLKYPWLTLVLSLITIIGGATYAALNISKGAEDKNTGVVVLALGFTVCGALALCYLALKTFCCSQEEGQKLMPVFADDGNYSSFGDEAYKASSQAKSYHRQGQLYSENQDWKKAFDFYKQAADLGLADAQIEVGYYYTGFAQVIPENRSEARKWFEKAAKQDDVVARSYLHCLDNLHPDDPFPAVMKIGNKVMFV